MNLNLLKRLFKIKSSTNSNDVGISTIDTSFIKVPKLSDLSQENQDKVMEYFNEIKYDNYETIVKYSDSLLEKSNKEIDFFVHDLEDIIKDISSIVKEINKDSYFKLLLYREEIKLSIEELNKIEQEAELRLIALDTYIKKEERRKYDFLGIFGKAERLRYLSDKSSLLDERQRLLITIKLNKQHLQIIYNTLNENKDLLDTMNNYLKTLGISYELSDVFDINMKYIDEIIEKSKLIDNYVLDDLILKIKKLYHYNYRAMLDFDHIYDDSEKKLNENEFKNLIDVNSLIPLIAKERRKIKQYAYEHRNDYKTIISDINTLVSKYEKMPSSIWNIEELNNSINNFRININKYGYLCEKYLNDNVINEIINSLLNINYYQYIINGRLLSDKRITPRMKSPKGPVPREGEFKVYLIPFDIRDKIDIKREIEYYDKLSLDLLKKFEDKYGVYLRMEIFERIRTDSIGKIDILNIIHQNGEFRYLYDILYGNFDIFYLDISFAATNENLKEFIEKITNKNFGNAFYGIQNSFIISIEELFYLLKYLGKDNYNLNKLFVTWNPFYEGPTVGNLLLGAILHKKIDIKTMSLRDLLGRVYTKKLESDYDNRILVIPKNINGLTKIIHTAIENKIGVYVSNLSMAISINEFLKINKEHNVKYLFINGNIYDELIKNNVIINVKVITVPDDVKYSELSSYLDRELEKEKIEGKVLSKTK